MQEWVPSPPLSLSLWFFRGREGNPVPCFVPARPEVHWGFQSGLSMVTLWVLDFSCALTRVAGFVPQKQDSNNV